MPEHRSAAVAADYDRRQKNENEQKQFGVLSFVCQHIFKVGFVSINCTGISFVPLPIRPARVPVHVSACNFNVTHTAAFCISSRLHDEFTLETRSAWRQKASEMEHRMYDLVTKSNLFGTKVDSFVERCTAKTPA